MAEVGHDGAPPELGSGSRAPSPWCCSTKREMSIFWRVELSETMAGIGRL